jgi:hypothetical protein
VPLHCTCFAFEIILSQRQANPFAMAGTNLPLPARYRATPAITMSYAQPYLTALRCGLAIIHFRNVHGPWFCGRVHTSAPIAVFAMILKPSYCAVSTSSARLAAKHSHILHTASAKWSCCARQQTQSSWELRHTYAIASSSPASLHARARNAGLQPRLAAVSDDSASEEYEACFVPLITVDNDAHSEYSQLHLEVCRISHPRRE